jgi:hypothetical protein
MMFHLRREFSGNVFGRACDSVETISRNLCESHGTGSCQPQLSGCFHNLGAASAWRGFQVADHKAWILSMEAAFLQAVQWAVSLGRNRAAKDAKIDEA